jgi:2-dehydropantoate 2-reductase
MMSQAVAVANAPGVVLLQPMEKRIAITLAAREHRLSMLQDLARPTREIDVLACSIAEMLSLVGLTTPTIDMVFDRALARHPRRLI